MYKPTYYAIIPANVRYSTKLTSSEKLLYGEITSLCNSTGKCFATNDYFAKLYSKDKVTISRWIKSLISEGFISASYDLDLDTKQIKSRIMSILDHGAPTSKNANSPTSKNAKDNNIININAQKLFEEWWIKYDKKTGKKKAKDKWLKLKAKDHDKCIEVVEAYVRFKNDRQYRPHPITYLNGALWDDEIPDTLITKEWKKQTATNDFNDIFGI
jgi:hypothetical protein